MYQIAMVFLWFITYSFIGWVYESLLFTITEKKPVNRGFLNSPFIPIYGFGALIVLFALPQKGQLNLLALFLSSAVLTCTLEYITGSLLERLFHAKWWDYSNFKFHINGRVSLAGAVVFGLLSVLLVEILHPFFSTQYAKIPHLVVYILSSCLFVIVIVDTFYTVKGILGLNVKLAEIQAAINREKEKSLKKIEEFKDNIIERIENSELNSIKIKELLQNKKYQEKRILKAFPKIKFKNQSEALNTIRNHIRNRKNKTK